jgi:hypothetical protein
MNLPVEDPNLQKKDQEEPNLSEDFGADSSPKQDESDQRETIESALPDAPGTSLGDLIEKSTDEEESPEFDFSALEASARANIEELGFAPLPEFERTTTRRRRSRQPLLSRLSDEEVSDRLENMAQRAVPTFDFFIFAIVAGSLMGIGYLLNAPAILLLAVVLAPFPAPWLGISLAAATGESRFLGQTLGGFFTAILIVFFTGLLAGLTSRIFMPILLDQAYLHARLWWPDLLLAAIGAITLVLLFSQKDDKPVLPGLILSYVLLLPISAAGFGLGNGTPGLWPQALAVFLVHLALSIVLGLAIFYYMGFRPIESIGYAWGAGVILVSLMIVVGFAGLGTLVPVPQPQIQPELTATPTAPIAATPSLAPATETPSPEPATITPQPSATSRPSATPVVIPTTAYGRIQFGATIRNTPAGTGITTIMDGYVVEILPDEPVTIDGNIWIRVKVTTAIRVIEGWVLQNLVVTPTPQP